MHDRLTSDQRYAFLAALLAWAMDAFDFCMLLLVFSNIEADKPFGASAAELPFVLTATLVMRPFGAFVFGIWADRDGRRGPLIADVLLYSCAGILCAIAPNFITLLVLRAIYGFGMGGEWGLGAALAMEKIPRARRGFYSGLLQAGYPMGYCLAAFAYLGITALDLSWRYIFLLSIIPALTTLLLRRRVAESEAWQATRRNTDSTRTTVRDILRDPKIRRRFCYLIALMTALNWMAHSVQDVYPTFLKDTTSQGGAGIGPADATWIIVYFNLGMIAGCWALGALSERIGRRRAIMLAAALALPVIPLFIFPRNGVALLITGAVMMGFLVEGAWGVIPAHLTEMSPDAIRGFYPGVTYQLGNLFAALNQPLQERLATWHGYPFALGSTIGPALLAVLVVTALGTEAKGAVFGGGPGPRATTSLHAATRG